MELEGASQSLRGPYHARTKDLNQGSSNFPVLSSEVEDRLSILSRIADVLGLDDLCFSSYSAAITRLSGQELHLKRSSIRFDHAENELRSHLASARHEERLINNWTETIEREQMHENAATIERRKDALVKKAKEYRKELDALMEEVDEPPVIVSQLANQLERICKRETDIKAKRAKIRAFQGLPPNLKMARLELKRARDEQMELIKLRERILRRMADGVT